MSAKYLFDKYLSSLWCKDIKVYSSWILAEPNTPFKETTDKLESLGVNPDKHIQTKLTKDLINQMDIVIVMTSYHRDFVEQNFGVTPYLFNELAYGEKKDLYDDSEKDYEWTLKELVEYTIEVIDNWLPNIYNFIQKKYFLET